MKNVLEIVTREQIEDIQDTFCEANHLYMACVDKDLNYITNFTKDEEILAFIDKNVPTETRENIVSSFSNFEGEDVIEFHVEAPYILLRGVAIRSTDAEFIGAWIVIAFNEPLMPGDIKTPAGLEMTSLLAFDESMILIATISDQFFETLSKMVHASDTIESMEEKEESMQTMLRRAEVLTAILKLMESDEMFTTISASILKEAGEFLQVSNACVLQLQSETEDVEIVSEWASDPANYMTKKFGVRKKFDIPFMTGRPYTISDDTLIPKSFADHFDIFGIKSGVFMPISISGQFSMYLCFVMIGQTRRWTVDDVRFLNDVKHIIQTVLIKRVTRNSLASSYNALSSIIENAGCAMCVSDMNEDKILYINDTFRNLNISKSDREEFEKVMAVTPTHMNGLNEYHAVESDMWFDVTFSTIEWVDGRDVRLATIIDITKIKHYQDKIEEQASEDYLTGLYNRMRFENDLVKELHVASRLGGQSAVILIDIDDFSVLNDTLGHEAGDELLKQFADKIKIMPQAPQKCYRLGGDEFAIILTNNHFDRLDATIEHILNLFKKPWVLDGHDQICSISIGVVMMPRDGVESSLIRRRLDVALHYAKAQGKNRVEFYQHSQMNSMTRRFDMERCLRDEAEGTYSGFRPKYSPLIDIRDNEKTIIGAHMHLNWDSRELDHVRIDEFVPLADYIGLIKPIVAHSMTRALSYIKQKQDMGRPEFVVHINLPSSLLLKEDLDKVIQGVLEDTRFMPENLVVDIADILEREPNEIVRDVAHKLRVIGVGICIDKLSTNKSLVNFIRDVGVDMVRIDSQVLRSDEDDSFGMLFGDAIRNFTKVLEIPYLCEDGRDETGFMTEEEFDNYLGE